IATFKFLEEKKLFKRLKNGFYQLNIGGKNDT
ncbi:ArsR family transcriptional regulator, partial [Campylobacter jejuni]|nr:ArsR family transcriptional regulator [Campylobacter jejuni]